MYARSVPSWPELRGFGMAARVVEAPGGTCPEAAGRSGVRAHVLENGEPVTGRRIASNESVGRVCFEFARVVPVLERFRVVEKEEPGAVDLVQFGTSRELGAVDQHGVEELDAVLFLEIANA